MYQERLKWNVYLSCFFTNQNKILIIFFFYVLLFGCKFFDFLDMITGMAIFLELLTAAGREILCSSLTWTKGTYEREMIH